MRFVLEMEGQNACRERALAELATRQHGVVEYQQLLALGFGAGAIDHRVRTGRLHRLHRGVYLVGHAAMSAEARDMAAVLACGRGAVLSHVSAAARWHLLRPNTVYVEVIAARGRRSQQGIRVRHAQLAAADRTKRDGIPITAVPRTLLDVASVAPWLLRRATGEADRLGWLNRNAIQQLLDRNRGRRGAARLRTLVAAVDPSTRRTRSDLEAAFLVLLRRHRLPMPVVNAKVEGHEVDMYWPSAKLIVELDSYEYHRTPAAFDADRRRDARLTAAGHQVLRVSEQWLDGAPAEVAAVISRLLRVATRPAG